MPTQREIAARKKNGEKPPASRRPAAPKIEPAPHDCISRSAESVGKLKCSCSNAPEVFGCENPAIPSGFCIPDLPQKPGDGPVVFHQGGQTDTRYLPYPLRTGEYPRIHEAICCSTCPHRREPPEDVRQLRRLGFLGQTPATVLHVASKLWADRLRAWLEPQVVPSAAIQRPDAESVATAIRLTGANLVAIHRLCLSVNDIQNLAQDHPAVKFVAVFHGAQNTLLANQKWPQDQLHYLQLAHDFPNIWYATPDRRARLDRYGWERAIRWPNVLACDPPAPAPIHQPAKLLIAGRMDIVKGYPAAILAAGVVNQSLPVEILCCVHEDATRLRPIAELARVPLAQRPWMNQAAFRKMIRHEVTLGLHPSLSDACPQVPLDLMGQSKPVVGSPACDFLPRSWTPDPNDPEAIAEAVLAILDNYQTSCEIAAEVARQHAAAERDEFTTMLTRVLG